MHIMNEQKDDQNFWNVVFSIFFIAFCYGLFELLLDVRGTLPTSISIFDLVLIVLATFRLTRLFVYDKITYFFRDLFFHSNEMYTEEGVTYFAKKERMHGPLRTVYELLTCPWCFSIWSAVVVTFFYFLTPLAWIPILILAISSMASVLQILANMVGWIAENEKLKATSRV
jgi:hypothetical protein